MTDYINKLLPLKIKKVEKGIGSFLTFNMKNDYLLWIYLTDWKIIDYITHETLLDSNLINENNYIELFENFLFCSLIKFSYDKNIVKFYFDNKYVLLLSENLEAYEPEDELFMLFMQKNSKVISYSFQNKFVIESYSSKQSKTRENESSLLRKT
ncbi:hypothetical protein ACMC56_16065 [Campylobacterota bacterium DY0563]